MMADLPLYTYTTQERIYGELIFRNGDQGGANLDISQRQLIMYITPAKTTQSGAVQAPVKTLTLGQGLYIKPGTNNVLVFDVSREDAQAWNRGDYTADVLDFTNGGDPILFMPVRLRYVDPGGIINYLNRTLSAVYSSMRQPIVTGGNTGTGPAGPRGNAILNGIGVPGAGTGNPGDFYIDTNSPSRYMYGPKAPNGSWGEGTPLIVTIDQEVLKGITDRFDKIDETIQKEVEFSANNYKNLNIKIDNEHDSWVQATNDLNKRADQVVLDFDKLFDRIDNDEVVSARDTATALALIGQTYAPSVLILGNDLQSVSGFSTTAGTLWIEAGSVCSDGALLTLEAYITSVGNGLAQFVLARPIAGGYAIEKQIPVAVTQAGPLIVKVGGARTPAINVQSGWLLGWYAPAGGPRIAYENGGQSLSLTTGGLAAQQAVSPTSGAARLALRATVFGADGGIVGNPLNPTASGVPPGNLWVESALPLRAGWLTRLRAQIYSVGSGAGAFVLLSKSTSSRFRPERIIPFTVSATGLLTLERGAFQPIYIPAGWYLGWAAPAGGASICFSPGGNSTFVAVDPPVTGTTYAVAASSARLSIDITTAGSFAPLAPRMAAAEGGLTTLSSTLDTRSLISARDTALAAANISAAPIMENRTIGNAIADDGDPTGAPAGTLWIDSGSVFADGAVLTLQAYVSDVGAGQGFFAILNPAGTDGVAYTIQTVISAIVTDPGTVTFYTGRDFPALAVPAGSRLGWWAPTGGALVAYMNGGQSGSAGSTGPIAGQTVTLSPGTARLALAASQLSVPDIVRGRPLTVAGNGVARSQIWLETAVPLRAGWLRQLRAQIYSVGVGNFVLASPHDGQWRLEAVIPFTATATGLLVLERGAFPATWVDDGWVLGWQAPSGGASVCYQAGGLSSYLDGVSGVSVGSTYTLAASGAQLAIDCSTTGSIAPVAPRLAALESQVASIQTLTRDVVTAARATVTGLTVFVLGMLGRNGATIPFRGSVVLNAPTTGTVTDEALTIVPGDLTYTAAAANRLANANVSGVVVKDAGTNAILVFGVDYGLGAEHGVVYSLSGSRAVKVSYNYTRRRYATIWLDPEALTLSVSQGTERNRDASEIIPARPNSSVIRLFNVRVANTIECIETWPATEGIHRSLLGQFEEDRRRARRATRRFRARVARGDVVKVAWVGDSIGAIQSQPPSRTSPNGPYRDRATASGTTNTYLRDAIDADLVNALPLYTSTALFGSDDGAGQVHTRMSWAWTFIDAVQAAGATVQAINFCVAGTTTAELVADSGWFNAVVNSGADLLLVHDGMNELGVDVTDSNIVTLRTAAEAAGMEVVVVAPPRTNFQGGPSDSFYTRTIRETRRAAEFEINNRTAAFLDSSMLYLDAYRCGLGISRNDMCQANLYNHPGIREHTLRGHMLARLIDLDGAIATTLT